MTTLLAVLMFLSASPVEIWPSADLKSASGKLGPEADAKGLAGSTMGAASLWRRAKSGQAELHRAKTDLIVVQEGTATLVYGGTIPDAKTSAPGELRGASIADGQSRKLAVGDIVRIPAGTPHQFVLAKGESIAYFALKLLR